MNEGMSEAMSESIDRRGFLKSAAGAGAAAMLPVAGFLAIGGTACEASPAGDASSAGGFRFIHFTDIHVQPEREADNGMAKALKAIRALDAQPEFIMTGGDMIMDALKTDYPRANLQFDLFNSVRGDHSDRPFRYCIGNHDIYGWGSKDASAKDHAAYGKAALRDHLEIEQTYYAFDQGGWRIYVLDNIQHPGNSTIASYRGYIDDEQYEWLEADLKAKPAATPAAVICHIPIITVTAFTEKAHRYIGDAYMIPSAAVCRDAMKLANLFSRHNVKLNLSGHIHQIDRVELNGVTYICDGAVSGNWWKGPLFGIQEGFGVIDLHPDGTFDHEYVDYGWESKVPAGKDA